LDVFYTAGMDFSSCVELKILCVELVALIGKDVELVTLYIKVQFVNIT